MLDKYKDSEEIIYKQMKNALNNLSHAYLFNLNNNVCAENMVRDFVKNIICSTHKDEKEYNNCEICRKIELGTYTECIEIYPDGSFIKKEQVDELQRLFRTKAIESTKKVYIIHDAERMNKSAANSMLKFLEEPNDNIVGILLTNNFDHVLETIQSRCQILKFGKSKIKDYLKENKIKENITVHKIAFNINKDVSSDEKLENFKDFIQNVISFIKKYEETGLKMIIHEKKYFLDVFKEKDEIETFFRCLVLFYRDVLANKMNHSLSNFDDYRDLLSKIASKNTINKIIYKLDVIIEKEKLIKSNANVNLLIDDIIISMEENIC